MPAATQAPATLRARKAIMWTREDCRKIEGMGLLPARWELVQGEIVSKTGSSLAHSKIAQRMNVWLMSVFASNRILSTCSVDVAPEDNPTSEPEPDILLLNRPADELRHNPTPGEIAFIVEVSDTTLDHDLGPKARLYGRAGIPEYWVIDINGRRIHQHRGPNESGYALVRVVNAGESIEPLARLDAKLTPERIFG